jgi:type I restriction-modification system DNA methylase subunit
MDKDTARQQVAALVAKFTNLSKRQRDAMNEQTIRLQFILPLFRALGWDIEDPSDMTAEEQIARGFVDFGFYLNGIPAFYLETKRPSESVDVLEHKKQAINYAYLRGVAWAVLTNFDELVVFNAEWKGEIHQAQFLSLHHADYAESNFDFLWYLSKPAMLARQLDKFAETVGKKDKKKPVNKVLLEQLLDWRERLFRNIRMYPENQQLWATPHEIDNAIQKLYDRLIFLRSVEDRKVDNAHLRGLLRTTRRAELFPGLLKLFREMNGIYNSNLFDDHTLDGLTVHDGELVYNLLDGLYTGRADGQTITYDFAAIGADILGSVYEQYLGYKVQDPEPDTPRLFDPDAKPIPRSKLAETSRQKKRKLQGIYYTPQYIVRYIVEQTVGRLLENGADPLTLRVVDPACGSGSFLIEAFDVLDRWLEKHRPDLPAPERRRHILTENLYGVDLDDQAVEVTRLNLTLRASLKREKLPMLTHIRCADSLRADWTDLFPAVSKAGGFDAVIGNPPYVRQETLGADFKTHAQATFETYAGTADLYVYFIEKGVKLLRDGGLYGVIVANKWLRAAYGKPLRQFLKRESLQSILDFGDLPVFEDAIAYPCILTVKRGKNGETVNATQVKTLDFDDLTEYVQANSYIVRRADMDDKGWSLAGGGAQSVLNKITSVSTTLGNYLNGQFYYGIKTGLGEAFVISSAARKALIDQDIRSAELLKPFLLGRDIKRYESLDEIRYLILIPNGWTDTHSKDAVDKWVWLQQNYPAIAMYLAPFKDKAEKRSDMGKYWWELRPCDYYDKFELPKIIYLRFQTKPVFTLDTKGLFHNDAVWFFPVDDKYLLGILNSKFGWFLISTYCTQIQGGYQLIWDYLKKIPIRRPNTDDPAEKAHHDTIVEQVETILRLKREQSELDMLFTDKHQELAFAIEAADRKIDAAVYALYGLTDEEIAVVEGK